MVRFGRPDWATRVFGADVVLLHEKVPAALTAAHVSARAASDAAATGTLHVYGTALWVKQHEALVSKVSSIDGARVVGVGNYELPVLANKVLFPLRYTDRSNISPTNARLPRPVSTQRERLFRAHAPKITPVQPYLDESMADLDQRRNYEVLSQLGADTELVLIAYACNLHAGVMNIEWGGAMHLGDGVLAWGEHSPLPLTFSAGLTGAVEAGASEQEPASRFDAGEEPGLPIGLRSPRERKLEVPPQTEHHPDEPRVQGNEED